MGVGSRRVHPPGVSGGGVGRGGGTAHQCRPGGRVGARLGGATHAELQHGTAQCRFADAGGFGGDQRGKVQPVQQRGLQQLGGGQRALHHGDRRVGVNHTTLGHRVQRERREVEVGEPAQEVVAEQRLTRGAAVPPQRLQVGVGGVRVGHPLGERRHPGGHAVPGLVPSVVRVAAEEVLKTGRAVGQSSPEVQLRHGQLVEVGRQDASEEPVAGAGVRNAHPRNLRPRVPVAVRPGTFGQWAKSST